MIYRIEHPRRKTAILIQPDHETPPYLQDFGPHYRQPDLQGPGPELPMPSPIPPAESLIPAS